MLTIAREKNSQGRAIIRRMIDLLDNVEELMSENDRDDFKDNDHNLDLTLILGSVFQVRPVRVAIHGVSKVGIVCVSNT